MSKAPPIPPDQQDRTHGRPDISGRHAQPGGAAAHVGQDTTHQGQSATARQTAPRWGKTQDR
jgi:hypothetical protein